MRTIGVGLVAAVMVAGCARLPAGWTPDDAAVPDTADTVVFLDRLATAAPAELADMPASEAASPNEPRAALHHALWLATPGHAGHDPAGAEAALRELLAADAMTPALGALVRLQLRELRARLSRAAVRQRLERENERLREQIRALTALERRMGDDDSDTDTETGAPAAPEQGE